MPLAQILDCFQSLPPLPTCNLGSSGADSLVDGFVYVLGPCGLSLCYLVVFLEFYVFFHLNHISLSQHSCYIVRGGALGICQGRATHVTALCHCI